MATETTVRLVDDLDGSDAVETVGFALDGADFEIDLSEAHADELRSALAEFVGAARRVQQQRQARVKAPKASSETSDAREWLLTNGYEVKAKGRIPVDLVDVWRQNKDEPQEATEAKELAAGEPNPLDTSDVAIVAWHQVKGHKVPDGGKVNSLMRDRYLKAHEAA